jgi:hypothetical protein
MAESQASVALDPSAPAAERYDAEVELTKSTIADQLLPPDVRASITQLQDLLHEQDLAKAGSNLIVGPWSGSAKKKGQRGPDSVFLDDMQLVLQNNGYWERSGALSFNSMRALVGWATPARAS